MLLSSKIAMNCVIPEPGQGIPTRSLPTSNIFTFKKKKKRMVKLIRTTEPKMDANPPNHQFILPSLDSPNLV